MKRQRPQNTASQHDHFHPAKAQWPSGCAAAGLAVAARVLRVLPGAADLSGVDVVRGIPVPLQWQNK